MRQTTLNWFSLAPDGKELVCATTDPATKDAAVSILTIDRKERRDLLRPNSGFSSPYWMPNGNFILLLKSGEIWAVSPAGGEPWKIELGVNRVLDFFA